MKGKPVEATGVSGDREALSDHQSGSRSGMVGGHMKSAVALDKPEPSQHFTGADVELGKYLFNDVAEHDGRVVIYNSNGKQRRAVFERRAFPGDSHVLERTVFLMRDGEDEHGKPIIDVVNFTNYTNHDHVFSSEKKPSKAMEQIFRGEKIHVEKGEVLSDMPCLIDGEFADGVHLATITTSCAEVIEDSYCISTEAADKMHAYGVEKITFDMSESEYLIDAYGKTINGVRYPQYFPNVGEAIRNDGLVIASRDYDPLYAAIDMTSAELRRADPHFDNCRYVDADKKHYENPSDLTGSRVIDIRVYRDETQCRNGTNEIPVTEENKTVLDKYAQGTKDYYRQLVDFYFNIGESVTWSPLCYGLFVEAFASEIYNCSNEYEAQIMREINHMISQGDLKESASRVFNRISAPVDRTISNPIKNYTIEIVVRYPIPVTVSSKITDRSGAKGIVGKMSPVEMMPLSEDGSVRVHVMRPANAPVRRSTYGGLFHIYWSAASIEEKARLKVKLDVGDIEGAWEEFCDYTACYNPGYANVINETHTTLADKEALFKEIYDSRIRLFIPHELDTTAVDITQLVRSKYPPKKHRLWIFRDDGTKVLTTNSFYIGELETLRLDKTGREFSSISSMVENYLGMIDASGMKRGTYPMNLKPIKWMGESEKRLLEAFANKLANIIHTRSNNPELARAECRGLMTSPTPSNPGYLIDKNKFPDGDSQVSRMIEAIHMCEGFELVKPERKD